MIDSIKCSTFRCYKVSDHKKCCSICEKKADCKNLCLNSPTKCGLAEFPEAESAIAAFNMPFTLRFEG